MMRKVRGKGSQHPLTLYLMAATLHAVYPQKLAAGVYRIVYLDLCGSISEPDQSLYNQPCRHYWRELLSISKVRHKDIS